MTNEEIKELRNDLVLLSIAITEMEKRIREGFFNNAVAIAEEHMDIVNKYNPIDDWLMIKKQDYNTIKNLIDEWGARPPQASTRDIRLNIKHIIKNNFNKIGDIEWIQ